MDKTGNLPTLLPRLQVGKGGSLGLEGLRITSELDWGLGPNPYGQNKRVTGK